MSKILAPSSKNIQKAAEALKNGELVAIPTETVYGIAADATNAEAIKKIYSVKSRPAQNPLIIHIADFNQLKDLVDGWSPIAETLARRFWPGPLTLVVKKGPGVASEATGGLDTVAIRMPAHPVAQALIRAAGKPLAAPSANRFMSLSPTRAEHVEPEIQELLSYVIDGGPCMVGLESTVVDVTEATPRILRPGGVSRGEIQAALGTPLGHIPPNPPKRRSPGMHARHYAPKAPLRLVEALGHSAVGLGFGEPQNDRQLKMPEDPVAYGAALYDALHRLDSFHPETIDVVLPPDDPEWEAVLDRLRKASAKEP